MKKETCCMHLNKREKTTDSSGALSFPIYQTATFAHPAVGESTGYDYSRLQNPTREQLEKIIAQLEQGIDAIAFTSGMAAITAVMELFEPGDQIITDDDLYGGSIRLFDNISIKNGLDITVMDCVKDDLNDVITKRTRAVFLEIPTNPLMKIADVSNIASICKEKGILLIVDNTFLTPYFLSPLELGADIVIHSGTKFLGGHHDTIAGFVVVKDEELSEQLRFIFKTTGACLAPFDSWLILRGLKTLAIRMERAEENAKKIAAWLTGQKIVKKVLYPGLKDHPGYEILKEQANGFGAMISFEVEKKEQATCILEKLQLIAFAESLGGTESLMTYPITQTHADVDPTQLEERGITECLLRISVGIESIEDLIEDLDQAFKQASVLSE